MRLKNIALKLRACVMSWLKPKAKTLSSVAVPESNVFAFQFWQLPDFGNFGDLFLVPLPPFFRLLLQTNALKRFHPRMALAWRLGGAWVAQG
ncbi:MAG TPA: hypothetical protein VKV30_13820 [Candidatus Angelobacter sp.]|nr:hypothetical protein [Candidatus Angelobacter sp.]